MSFYYAFQVEPGLTLDQTREICEKSLGDRLGDDKYLGEAFAHKDTKIEGASEDNKMPKGTVYFQIETRQQE